MKYWPPCCFLLFLLSCGSPNENKPQTPDTAAETPPLLPADGLRPQVGNLSPVFIEHEPLPGYPPARYFALGRRVFFAGGDNRGGRGLWCSDGTTAGTKRIKSLPGGYGDANPGYLAELNGLVYFVAQTGTTALNRTQIWRTNGTEAGTQLVSPPDIVLKKSMAVFKDRLYFSGSAVLGDNKLGPLQFFQSDGTPGQAAVLLEAPEDSPGMEHFFIWDNLLFFTTTDNRQQMTIWRTDGSRSGTLALHTFPGRFSAQGDYATVFFEWQGKTCYVAGTEATGAECWSTDGTPAGTRLLADLNPGPGSAFQSAAWYFPHKNGLYWWQGAPQEPNLELWYTRGTAATTIKLGAFPDATLLSGHSCLVALGDKLYFLLNNDKGQSGLWTTDGTPGGTRLIKPLSLLSNDLLPVGDALYFSARQEAFPDLGCLWRSDGTAAGTRPDLEPGPQYGLDKTAANPRYLFLHDQAIWYMADNGLNRYEPFAPPLRVAFPPHADARFNILSGDPLRAQVSGGVGPYTLHWANEATGPEVSNLHDGVQTVVVTDSRGLQKTARFLYLKGDSIRPFTGLLRIARQDLPRFSAGTLVQAIPARQERREDYEEPVYALARQQIACYWLEPKGYSGRRKLLPTGLMSDSIFLDWFRMGHPDFQDNTRTDWPEAGGYLITPMPNGGFESVQHIFAAWKAAGRDSLELLGLFPEEKSVGIGSIIIRRVLPLAEQTFLVLGAQSGGDAGDAAGSEWAGVWRLPLDFRIRHEAHWHSNESDTEFDKVELKWDPAAQTIVSERYRVKTKNGKEVGRKLLKSKRIGRGELLAEGL